MSILKGEIRTIAVFSLWPRSRRLASKRCDRDHAPAVAAAVTVAVAVATAAAAAAAAAAAIADEAAPTGAGMQTPRSPRCERQVPVMV